MAQSMTKVSTLRVINIKVSLVRYIRDVSYMLTLSMGQYKEALM